MEDRANKSELLTQLKIDKADTTPKGVSPGVVIGIAASSLLVGAFLGFFLFGNMKSSEDSPADRSQIKPTNMEADSPDAIQQTNFKSLEPSNTAILNASGYITARLIATVSAEVLGLITTVDVEEGMKVQADQVLARLDDSVAQVSLELARAQVKALQARLQSIQADLDEAQRVLKRIVSLEDVHFSSEAELTRARANVDKSLSALASTKAEIEVAKLEVARQQENLDNHTIRAPFAGVVTVKNAQPGEIVSPSSAGGGFTRTGICTIVDMESLEIEVDVNEAFIGRVYPSQVVVATLDAYPQWDIPASVIAIIPTADRAKATVRVRIKIELKDPRILPDMGVKVAFLK